MMRTCTCMHMRTCTPTRIRTRTRIRTLTRTRTRHTHNNNTDAHAHSPSFHRIRCCALETKQLINSNVNAILTQQTCGQLPCTCAGSKRRALAFYFPVRIWYMFSESKCRGESDLGLCTISGLARMRLRSVDFRMKSVFVFGRKICPKSAQRSGILFASPEVVHKPGLFICVFIQGRGILLITSHGATQRLSLRPESC